MYRKNLYLSILNNDFELDIRDFKPKMAECPDKNCQHSKGFNIKVQREVDVAIVTRFVKSLNENPNLDVVVLLAGDGDFVDMVEFFTQTLRKKVY
ncbi:MAG: NYN domain-containing protein, partial [Flammeovirgaceae bacterium]